jgi:hypothetical protein
MAVNMATKIRPFVFRMIIIGIYFLFRVVIFARNAVIVNENDIHHTIQALVAIDAASKWTKLRLPFQERGISSFRTPARAAIVSVFQLGLRRFAVPAIQRISRMGNLNRRPGIARFRKKYIFLDESPSVSKVLRPHLIGLA